MPFTETHAMTHGVPQTVPHGAPEASTVTVAEPIADSADALTTAAADCCAPSTREAIGADEAERLAKVLKAVADPARLRLVSLVAAHDDLEACVCDLTEPLGLSQPTVSHHLKVLVDAGILSRDKRGTWAYYRLVPGALASLANQVLGL